MGLIEAVLATILVAAISRQTADEFKAWMPRLIDIIVRHVIRVLPKNQRGRYSEEWRSHIDQIPGEIGKLLVALSLLPAAWKLSHILPKAGSSISAGKKEVYEAEESEENWINPLDWPEDFLWIKKPDGSLTIIEPKRLNALRNGAAPVDATESLLAANPVEISRILACLGNEVIEIDDGGPLPKWNQDPLEVY